MKQVLLLSSPHTHNDKGYNETIKGSCFHKSLNIQKEEYQKIIKQLKSNKQLKKVLGDVESKQAMLNVIHALLVELDA